MKTALFPQLQAFLVVARLRSFSSAARELGVSRSAVSQTVRQLEEELRVVLLARTTRSVSLTDAGRRLVESAGPALGQALAAMVMDQLREGRLRRVLERYAPTVPGFFLYFPSVARRSPALRVFVEAAKELAVRVVS